MKLIRKITFPFVPLYYAVTSLRNTLYNLGVKKSTSFNFPVICVGNLSVGGTGKTPMIEYLINLLKTDYKVATLSRGYKRKTTGFVLANESSTAELIGDEPFQFYTKFSPEILVAVDADRVHGIQQLQSFKNKPEVVLLDDAFQHRKVKAGLNVLLTTYSNPYFFDVVLPTGNLREPRNGAKRADIIVVTKCPDNLSETEKATYIAKIKPRSNQKVFFSFINYSNTLISASNTRSLDELPSFTLVTGIANATPLIDFLTRKELNFEHLNYKDHHEFTTEDIVVLQSKSLIVTTEKDFMRLKHYEVLADKLYYIPITVKLTEQEVFNTLIQKFVTS